MDIIASIALGAGAAWASGINVYAVILALGVLGGTGHLALPSDLQILTNPLIIAAAGFMYCVEFFADKTPGVDSVWDALHTFIRIPAGAMLAAGTFGHLDPVLQIVAFLLGGTLAATSHATKAGARVLINTSPEPVSNWTASLIEDVVAFSTIWGATHHPAAWLAVLAVIIALTVWALPKIWSGVARLFAKLKAWFGGRTQPADPQTRVTSG